MTGLLPVQAFQSAFPQIEARYGWRILRADSHPARGCEANVTDLHAAATRGLGLASDATPIADPHPPGELLLMGYSKGMPDLLTLLQQHPELARRVRAIVSWAGAVGGSFTANGIYEELSALRSSPPMQMLEVALRRLSPHVAINGLRCLDEYDIVGALLSLTTFEREKFLAAHGDEIDALNIPIFNFTGATIVTETPYFQLADMLRLSQHDANNDMQLTQLQARLRIPMATDIAVLHGHHWDVAYDPFPPAYRMGSGNLDHPFPKRAAVVATVKLAIELGLVD